jgi:hypothetical protein
LWARIRWQTETSLPPLVQPKLGGGAAAGLQPLPTIRILKNTGFVDTMLSKVLRDLPFTRNQPTENGWWLEH